MHTPTSAKPGFARFMLIAWILVAAKCAWVAWAVGRWDIPMHAAWIILPTLAFALLATALGRSRALR